MLFRKMFTQACARQTLFTAAKPFLTSSPAAVMQNLQMRTFVATMMHGQGIRVSQKVTPFKTDTPSKSNRHHRGLYHKKTHGRRFQRCFSMKKSIVTMKPNVKSRNLRSDILGQSFKLDITMKARRCIMKAGSLDNYLLTTKAKDIDSKFGMYLRDLIK